MASLMEDLRLPGRVLLRGQVDDEQKPVLSKQQQEEATLIWKGVKLFRVFAGLGFGDWAGPSKYSNKYASWNCGQNRSPALAFLCTFSRCDFAFEAKESGLIQSR